MKNLYKSLILFQQQCDPIPMNATVKVNTKSGSSYSFKYADLAQIHEIVKPILHDNGLGFFQSFTNNNLNTIVFHAESGEQIESTIDLTQQLHNKSTQDAGGVITYFKRYMLSAILGIISEEDDDANSSMGNTVEKTPEKPWLNPNTKQWEEAIIYLRDSGGTIENVLRKYRLSRQNREKLLSESI